MKIEMWPIKKVTPYARNPRKNDRAVAKVAASLAEFGFRQPIVVDEQGVIIVGHTRFDAAQRLGMAKVPVHVAVGLTPGQVKAYRLTDNRVHEDSEWDGELLKIEMQDLKAMEFDLELTGFEGWELKDMEECTGPVVGDGTGADGSDKPQPIIAFTLVFETQEQQAAWFAFVKHLRDTLPDMETIGARLKKFVEDQGYEGQEVH